MNKKIREYVLKGKEIFVGLEDSKRTWKICVRSGRNVVHETSMPAEYDNLKNYFKNKFPECKIRVMYEAGFRGFELHDQLVADGWECVVTPPHTVSQEKCLRQKNDRIDSRRLAKNNENNDFKACSVPSRKLRQDRQVIRVYTQIRKDTNRVCNRIRRTIDFHGLEKHFPQGDWKPRTYREAEEKIKTLQLSEHLIFSFDILFSELRYLRETKLALVRRLRLLAKEEPYKRNIELLRTAPGIGLITAVRLALEWGDISRFSRKEQFAAFLGLVPSEYSSGEMDHKGHITKQGSREVRSALIECAWVAIRKDPVLLDKYRSITSRCGSSKKAIVAVAKKFAIRLRSVLLNGEPYQVGVIECSRD